MKTFGFLRPCAFLIILGVLCCPLAQGQDLEKEELNLLVRATIDKVVSVMEKLEDMNNKIAVIQDTLSEVQNCTEENRSVHEAGYKLWSDLVNQTCNLNQVESFQDYIRKEIENATMEIKSEILAVHETTVSETFCWQPFQYVPGFGCVTGVKENGINHEKAKKKCSALKRSRLLEGIHSQEQLDLLQMIFGASFGQYGVWVGITKWKWTEGGQDVLSSLRSNNSKEGVDKECAILSLRNEPPYITEVHCNRTFYSLCQIAP